MIYLIIQMNISNFSNVFFPHSLRFVRGMELLDRLYQIGELYRGRNPCHDGQETEHP